MKTSVTLRTLCVCLLTVMIVGTGCDKLGLGGGGGGETSGETTNTDTTPPPETTNTDTTPPPETTNTDTTDTTGNTAGETTGETTAEVKKFDKAQFLNAYYEQTCVQAKVLETEKQQTILNEVYPRYGFKDKAEFETARGQFKDEPDVKIVLEERMKGCTKEAALAFERNGAANVQVQADMGTAQPDMGAAQPDMGTPVKKVVKPVVLSVAGNYAARGVVGGGVQRGSLSLRVSNNKTFTGFFSGQRDGKRFNIPLRGTVSGTSLSGNGKQGTNNMISLRGSINGKNLNATISGTLNAQRVTIPLTAKR